ncbi:hypothetical protein Dehly_0285 [Dehalogenimonas lykanthroporepellens BL-DC-9]|nr:hypothetical protein Dehly_0285 [Dehalogenimonas lykanthroporepellens BL-DC-9]
MYKIKSCPRCRIGDVFSAADEYGAYQQCFQCGWVDYGTKYVTQEEAEVEKKELSGSGAREKRGRR